MIILCKYYSAFVHIMLVFGVCSLGIFLNVWLLLEEWVAALATRAFVHLYALCQLHLFLDQDALFPVPHESWITIQCFIQQLKSIWKMQLVQKAGQAVMSIFNPQIPYNNWLTVCFQVQFKMFTGTHKALHCVHLDYLRDCLQFILVRFSRRGMLVFGF